MSPPFGDPVRRPLPAQRPPAFLSRDRVCAIEARKRVLRKMHSTKYKNQLGILRGGTGGGGGGWGVRPAAPRAAAPKKIPKERNNKHKPTKFCSSTALGNVFFCCFFLPFLFSSSLFPFFPFFLPFHFFLLSISLPFSPVLSSLEALPTLSAPTDSSKQCMQ